MSEETSQDLITYITLLSAMQVVQNCSLELEGSVYDQGRVKMKTKEANLAKGDGTALANITSLTRQNIDLSKYKLVEIEEDEQSSN